MQQPHAVFSSHSRRQPGWDNLAFGEPVAAYAITTAAAVPQLVAQAEAATAKGYWGVLCLSYEAAAGLNSDLRTFAPGPLPVAWLGIFTGPTAFPDRIDSETAAVAWQATVSQAQYHAALGRLQEHIAAGDIYQVNYTMQYNGAFAGNALAWYQQLAAAQQAGFCAYVDMGRWQVLSLSPELFFQRLGNRVTTRPMKGTLRRGRWQCEDESLARRLRACPKNCAENLMIVDLLRNDLGRVAIPGSVHVPELFAVEAYGSVLQMVTPVQADVMPETSLLELLQALFPCGSITGAPKIRAQQLIADTEAGPRGIYTGCIGLLRPGGDCIFNVAIRTVVVDAQTQTATVGVGGGITADSQAADEYDECRMKLRFLSVAPPAAFGLLETLLLADGCYALYDRHLQRLSASAAFFGFNLDYPAVEAQLAELARAHPLGHWKVRLIAAAAGQLTVEAQPFPVNPDVKPGLAAASGPAACRPPPPPGWPWPLLPPLPGAPLAACRLSLATAPVDPGEVLLYHKTTARAVYERARLDLAAGCDDVLLYNTAGYITESTIANVVYERDGQLWTPPCRDGLLAGTLRAELLAAGSIGLRSLRVVDLTKISRLFVVNSVRGWLTASVA